MLLEQAADDFVSSSVIGLSAIPNHEQRKANVARIFRKPENVGYFSPNGQFPLGRPVANHDSRQVRVRDQVALQLCQLVEIVGNRALALTVGRCWVN